MDDFLCGTGLKPEVASILNGVFVACDDTRTGLVSVSKFISFLKEKATGTEVRRNITYLYDTVILSDPSATS